MSATCLSKRVGGCGAFFNAEEVLHQAETVLRRQKIYSILSEKKAPSEMVSLLDRFLRTLLEHLVGIDEKEITCFVQSQMESIPKPLEQLPPIYLEKIVIVSSRREMAMLLKEFVEDCSYLSLGMVCHSDAGDRGVLIVTDPFSQEVFRSFVVKWVDSYEVESTRIYQLFARRLGDFFKVPAFREIDLKGKKIGLLSEDAAPFVDRVSRIYEECLVLSRSSRFDVEDIGKTLDCRFLMISEKVSGEDFFAFISTRYQEMDPRQKEVFFKKLGVVGLLDLVLHHEDRIQIAIFLRSKGSYSLLFKEDHKRLMSESGNEKPAEEYYGPNLGNLMVGEEGEVFLIDNGLEWDREALGRSGYTEFLNELFNSPGWEEKIAQAILGAIDAVCEVDETERDVSLSRISFLADLHLDVYVSSLRRGVVEALAFLMSEYPDLGALGFEGEVVYERLRRLFLT
jgi:hypothetical protein